MVFIYQLLCKSKGSKRRSNKLNKTLSFRKNSKSTSFPIKNSNFAVFNYFSKTHCASKNWPIWTQKVPKEAQRCRIPTSIRVFPKIFCCKWAVGCRKFVQYICMLCPGRFILVESVRNEFLTANRTKKYFWKILYRSW